jgi:hypothetical protein
VPDLIAGNSLMRGRPLFLILAARGLRKVIVIVPEGSLEGLRQFARNSRTRALGRSSLPDRAGFGL